MCVLLDENRWRKIRNCVSHDKVTPRIVQLWNCGLLVKNKTMAITMEAICERKPTRCLKVPLKSTEQIYLVFLIPAVLGCCIYMVHLAADLVVAVQHFREGNPIWGGCTLGLIYAPAVAYFILTVSRPDWWMTEDQKLSWNVVTWFGIQICQMIAFPLFALYRWF